MQVPEFLLGGLWGQRTHYNAKILFAFSVSFSQERAEYEKVIDVVSVPTSQIIFKKLPLVKFWYSFKEEYQQLSEEAINLFLSFSVYICVRLDFSSNTQSK